MSRVANSTVSGNTVMMASARMSMPIMGVISLIRSFMGHFPIADVRNSIMPNGGVTRPIIIFRQIITPK